MIKTPLSTVIGGAFWTPGVTMLGSSSQNSTQLIKSLFSLGEQGFYYDPNDLSTMFQDAAGTVPVNGVGQAVGLVKDKSGRNNHARQTTSASRPIFQQKPILGSELVVNGDFSNGTTGWGADQGAVIDVVDGKLRVKNATTASGFGNAYTSFPTVIGKTYALTGARVSSSTQNINNAHVGTQSGTQSRADIIVNANLNGVLLHIFVARTNVTYVSLNADRNISDGYVDYSYVSVKELLGYRTGQNYIVYDGVDDRIKTTLPAQLTGCTVVRSVPNVGTQILTVQTIPATYEDNKDHCGLIVINRVLTPSETSAITAEFNKRAGV